EQASESPSDGRTDQYALAVITYELLTGQRVFQTASWRDMLEMHRVRQPEPPSKLQPSILPEVDQAILRALSKNPNDRFPSCSSFAAACGCKSLSTQHGDDVRYCGTVTVGGRVIGKTAMHDYFPSVMKFA